MISDGEYTLEVIPTAGNFKQSLTLDNAIRYSDVFEHVDFQYTVLGDSIKEDIILLEPQKRNEFSYQLKSNGFSLIMVGKGNTAKLAGSGTQDASVQQQYFGDNGHTMVGYSEDFGHCRALIAIDNAWESLVGKAETTEEEYRYDVDLNRRITKMTQKNGGAYAYSYDQVHRLTSIKTPLGYERQFTYDVADNIVKETDNLSRTSSYEYDIMHRMTTAVDPKGGITTYGHDIRGNESQVTNALGYTWNYQYDQIDQLTASIDPEGKATKAVYNLVGEIATITKPGECTTSFGYDGNYNNTQDGPDRGIYL